MDRRRRDGFSQRDDESSDGGRRRLRSRSFSPISSRLRKHTRRRELPPPIPVRAHHRSSGVPRGATSSNSFGRRSRSLSDHRRRSRSSRSSRSFRKHRRDSFGDAGFNGSGQPCYHRSRSPSPSRSRSRSRSWSPRSRSRSRSISRDHFHRSPRVMHSRTRTRSRTNSGASYRQRSGRRSGPRSDRNDHRHFAPLTPSRSNSFHSHRRRSRSWKRSERSDRSHRGHRGSKRDRDNGGHHKKKQHSSKGDRDDVASDDSAGHDDTIGSYQGKPGDYIANRYKILREAGLGTFGRVLECLDKQRDMVVAIKVVRKVEKYTESAKIEARILEDVNHKDKRNESLCVQLHKWFEYKGHLCMVMERLGCSLYEYLKSHDYKPFPIAYIRAFAWQLLNALDFIHGINLIHTDLKPENILLVDDEELGAGSCSSSSSVSSTSSLQSQNGYGSSSKRRHKKRGRNDSQEQCFDGRETCIPPVSNAVKLIDFGGATYDDESKSSIINTRQYRSPEVILGLGWSFPSDIWSAGCIIGELYIGELLFATHENLEHLALIERCIGRLPNHMVVAASRNSSNRFFHRGRLDWPGGASTEESVAHVRKMKSLKEIITPQDADAGLLDLLQLMLVLDPEKRVTAREALNHPFFDCFSRKDIGHK